MKKIKNAPFLLLLSILTLASCDGKTSASITGDGSSSSASGTTTSSSSSAVDSSTVPFEDQSSISSSGNADIVITNYTRSGTLSCDFQSQGALSSLPSCHYGSAVDYAFETRSDGSLSSNAELLVHPNTVADKTYGNYSVQGNFDALASVLSGSKDLFWEESTAEGNENAELPDDIFLSGWAYRQNSESDVPTRETIAVNLVSGEKAVYSATSEGQLRAFDETDVSDYFDLVSGKEDSAIQTTVDEWLMEMDVPTLLNLLDTFVDRMIPEGTLRQLLMAMGDTIDILSEGLDVDITPGLLTDSSTVKLSLNADGLDRSSESLGAAFGMPGDVALTKAEVSVVVFNESKGETKLKDQLGGMSVSFSLDVFDEPAMDFDLALNFGRTSTEIAEDYFDGIANRMASYRTIDGAFHDFYGKIKPFLTDASSIDLSQSTQERIRALQEEYEGLSASLKFMLGSLVDSKAIARLYEEGRRLLEGYESETGHVPGLYENWESRDSRTFSSFEDIDAFLGNIGNYSNWRGAIAEREGGAEILAAIDDAVRDSVDSFRAYVDGLVSDREGFRKNPASLENIEAILRDLDGLDVGLSDMASGRFAYLMDEEQNAEIGRLCQSVAGLEEEIYGIFAQNLVSSMNQTGNMTYDLLFESLFKESGFYAKAGSRQGKIRAAISSLMMEKENAWLQSRISGVLQSETDRTEEEILSTFKETDDKEEWVLYTQEIEDRIRRIEELSEAFLADKGNTDRLRFLVQELSSFYGSAN